MDLMPYNATSQFMKHHYRCNTALQTMQTQREVPK